MHTATLRAVGGSLSVTLPRQMLRTLGLAAGSAVAVTVEEGRLVLSPTRPRYALAELLAGMKPGDMPTAARPSVRSIWRGKVTDTEPPTARRVAVCMAKPPRTADQQPELSHKSAIVCSAWGRTGPFAPRPCGPFCDSGSFARQRDHLRAASQLVQIVGPLHHHLAPLHCQDPAALRSARRRQRVPDQA